MMGQIIPVRDVLQHRGCSPQCLLASEPDGRCACVCGGKYHGALADASVDAAAVDATVGNYSASDQWWIKCDRGGWSERLRDESSTVIETASTVAFNRCYRQMNQDRGYFLATIRRGRGWTVEWDAPSHDETLWPDPYATEAARQFAHALLKGGRITGATCAATGVRPEWGSLEGFRGGLDEARTAEVLISEAMAGNPCGTIRALYVLLGQGDPVKDGYDPASIPLFQSVMSARASSTASNNPSVT